MVAVWLREPEVAVIVRVEVVDVPVEPDPPPDVPEEPPQALNVINRAVPTTTSITESQRRRCFCRNHPINMARAATGAIGKCAGCMSLPLIAETDVAGIEIVRVEFPVNDAELPGVTAEGEKLQVAP